MIRPAMILAVLLLAAPALAGPVEFAPPKEWKKEEPTSKMRKFQWSVPKAEGDDRDGLVVVYYFGRSGGTVEDNIKRWKEQVTQGEGDPAPKKTERTCGGLKVTVYDQVGTYAPPAFGPHAPKEEPRPNTRVFNAVVESGEGSYFVKFAGPKATVTKNEKAFLAFLDGLVATGAAKGVDEKRTY